MKRIAENQPIDMNVTNLLTIKEASVWATGYTGKNVTPSNIAYLIQYGRVKKNGDNGAALVSVEKHKKDVTKNTDFNNFNI